MKRYNKPLLALLIGAMSIAGAAGVAHARPGGHGGYFGGGGPCYGMQQVTPEMHQMMEKAYNEISPLLMELRAKQSELTAKIYGGADEKTIKALTDEVAGLQARVTEARVGMQRQFAKAGVPLGCAGGFGHMRGHGGPHAFGPMPGPCGGYGPYGPGPSGMPVPAE